MPERSRAWRLGPDHGRRRGGWWFYVPRAAGEGSEGDAHDGAVDAGDRHGLWVAVAAKSGGLLGLIRLPEVDVPKPCRVAREVKQLQGVGSGAVLTRLHCAARRAGARGGVSSSRREAW